MIQKLIRFSLPALAAALFAACSSGRPAQIESVYATVPQESVCLAADPAGPVTVKAWGTGSSRAEAVDNALKRALTDALFKGFSSGQGVAVSGRVRPLISEVNAQERYDYYFSPFFSKGGEYLRYASEKAGAKAARKEASGKGLQSISIIVNVDRNALRDRLIADEIIKP